MKTALFGLVLLVTTFSTPSVAADIGELRGTWSGNWTPKGGVPDAITLELREDEKGALTGRFLTPVQMDFSKASFNAKTSALALEAVDQKSGKHYKLEAKVNGTELNGTLQTNEAAGTVRLIKWTFFGR